MTALNELYQEMIIDHGRKPRNFHATPTANAILEGFNPLCGDRLTIYLSEKEGTIADVSFQGNGCAISMASASMMTDAVKGKTVAEAKSLFTLFQHLVKGDAVVDPESLGKLAVLSGVSEFPARVKCATLAWHTLIGALQHQQTTVSTENDEHPIGK